MTQSLAHITGTVFAGDPKYGFIGDGSSHTLGSVYADLAAAQEVYPFATDLSQEVDYCALKLASNDAFGADEAENNTSYYLNRRLILPPGRARFGDDTWTIRKLKSGVIEGAGKLATTLTGNNTVLAFDGLWYSEISNLSIACQTTGATAAFEIDGDSRSGQGWHPYDTFGVQGNTLRNMLIDGGQSDYAFALCRNGSSNGQGSENTFINLHLSGAAQACYAQYGFNALANTFIGGNFQNYQQDGIYVLGGNIAVINTGFQSTRGYEQILNDGWDIHVGQSGAYEGSIVYGCRTESLRFLRNHGATLVDVRACVGRCAVQGWSAGAWEEDDAVYVDGSSGQSGKLFVCTTAGTSGVSEPTWPTSGTVSDGSVVWTYTYFESIKFDLGSGRVDLATVQMPSVDLNLPEFGIITVDEDYAATIYDEIIVVDATSGPVSITPYTYKRGKPLTVKKADASSNAVTIVGGGESGGDRVIAGGAAGSRTIVYNDGVAGTRRWLLIGSS